MHQKNIILSSLKESFIKIKNHPILFLSLVFLEIIFIMSLVFVQLNYQIKIMENSREILNYFQGLNLNEDSIDEKLLTKENILGDEPLQIYRKFNELVIFIVLLVSFTAGIILFFNTLSWGISEIVFNKLTPKSFFRHLGKLFIINLIYISIFISFLAVIFQRFYLELILKNWVFLFIALVGILTLLYFMFISLALANQKPRDVFKKTFLIGTRKAGYLLAIYSIILVIMLGLGGVLFLVQDMLFILFMSAGIIYFFAVVFCRFFMIVSVRKLL